MQSFLTELLAECTAYPGIPLSSHSTTHSTTSTTSTTHLPPAPPSTPQSKIYQVNGLTKDHARRSAMPQLAKVVHYVVRSRQDKSSYSSCKKVAESGYGGAMTFHSEGYSSPFENPHIYNSR